MEEQGLGTKVSRPIGRRADSLPALRCYRASLLGNEVGPEPSEADSKSQITHSGTKPPPRHIRRKTRIEKFKRRVYFTCNLK